MTIIKEFYAQPMIFIYLEALAMFATWTAAMLLLREKERRIVALAGTAISFALILFFTLYGRFGQKMDTVPDFLPLINFVKSDLKSDVWRSMFLNILLFMPPGLSLPFALSGKVKHNVLATIMSCAVLSVLIELVQLVFSMGKFEFNDMIMNTLGAAIGTLSYLLVSLILKKANERSS